MAANPAPKQKNKNSLANLAKGNSKDRKKAPRSQLTTAQIDQFCVHYKITGIPGESCIFAGFSPRYAYQLTRNPKVIKRLAEIDAEMLQQTIKDTVKKVCLKRDFLDGELMHRIANGKTHFMRGDQDIVKAIEIGYKAMGIIEPSKVINNNNNSAAVAASTQIDVYKPLWLQEREAKLLANLNQKYEALEGQIISSRSKLSLEEAQEYLAKAEGDKDKAREMALADGREF